MTTHKRPNRVQRALALLARALRYSQAHKQADRTARIRKARNTTAAIDPPKAPKPPPPTKPAHPEPLPWPAIDHCRNQSQHGPRFSGPNNGAGQCRLQCRIALGMASVGDFDGDGSADAEDAWKAAKHRHPGDRNPPRGMGVFWGGGSNDNGHEAISAGMAEGETETHVWSTDILRTGFFDRVPLSLIEQRWGLPYLGWAEDDAGHMIDPHKTGA